MIKNTTHHNGKIIWQHFVGGYAAIVFKKNEVQSRVIIESDRKYKALDMAIMILDGNFDGYPKNLCQTVKV